AAEPEHHVRRLGADRYLGGGRGHREHERDDRADDLGDTTRRGTRHEVLTAGLGEQVGDPYVDRKDPLVDRRRGGVVLEQAVDLLAALIEVERPPTRGGARRRGG